MTVAPSWRNVLALRGRAGQCALRQSAGARRCIAASTRHPVETTVLLAAASLPQSLCVTFFLLGATAPGAAAHPHQDRHVRRKRSRSMSYSRSSLIGILAFAVTLG